MTRLGDEAWRIGLLVGLEPGRVGVCWRNWNPEEASVELASVKEEVGEIVRSDEMAMVRRERFRLIGVIRNQTKYDPLFVHHGAMW